MKIITTVLTAFILLAVTQVASPQDGRFELAGVFTTTFQKELDAADLGIGVRAGYLVTRLVTLEGELDFTRCRNPRDSESMPHSIVPPRSLRQRS